MIDPIHNISSNAAASRVPVQTLGQEDFLKLLIAQLTSQDPLNPQKDTDFIAQMASFSALEQSKSMQNDMSRMRADQQLLHANSLLGRTVEIQTDSGDSDAGLVSAVQVEAGMPKIVVNGESYNLNRVLTIAPSMIA
jgi:flagellar basal-body rod modification protein FlgD